MKIGYPNHPRKDLLEEIAWIAESGFDFVDLCLEPDRAAIEQIDPPRVREALDATGLDVLGHLAWYLPIGSPMPQIRRAAVAAANDYLEVFAAIGMPAVTIHAHWPPGMFTIDEGIALQVESLRDLVAAGANDGIRIMYEPIATEKDAPQNVARILNEVPELLCHLDMGHSNVCGRKPQTAIRELADRLYHVHVHDNDGFSDLHLPPGTGTIDWPEVFRAFKEVGYDSTLTLEVFSTDRDYVLLAKRKIEELCG